MTGVIRLAPYLAVMEVKQHFIGGESFAFTGLLAFEECCISPLWIQPQLCQKSAGHSECFSNWVECKGVCIQIAKGSPFLSKRSPYGWFSFSPLTFFMPFNYFSDFLTWTFITFIIIYLKIRRPMHSTSKRANFIQRNTYNTDFPILLQP